jgi:hypothetical protein
MGGLTAQAIAPISAAQISQIDIGGYSDKPKLPNKKVTMEVHTAHGGYVVRIGNGYGAEDDMYVIGLDQDLGQEIGKIITHHTLAKE